MVVELARRYDCKGRGERLLSHLLNSDSTIRGYEYSVVYFGVRSVDVK
jgi:hypothetical protein